MEPLRIRAYMQDGRVAGGDPALPLDSMLAFASVVRDYGDRYFNDLTNKVAIQPGLPLDRRGQGQDWYWACSINQSQPVAEYVVHWHKRFDDEHIAYLAPSAKKVETGSGRYRGYRMPMPILLFDYLEWFAVGDAARVRDLCRLLTHVGKKSSQGFGPVAEWEVIPWSEDWSCWRDGQPMRPIPVSDLPAGAPAGLAAAVRGIRPPYWHTPAWRRCLLPRPH